MYRAFNMGVGMVFIVDQKSLDSISKILNTITPVYEIGKVIKGNNIVTYI
jgi:phosphoribosylaminoimidazole (AIR) synthetase